MKAYLAIDLKSYYASAECVARKLDPLATNLVVADPLPDRKDHLPGGLPFAEGLRHPRTAAAVRGDPEGQRGQRGALTGGHPQPYGRDERRETLPWGHPPLTPGLWSRIPPREISYLVVPPRMAYYMKTSAEIYSIYLKYIAPEDIHVYSIDEVFMDVTAYLKHYHLSAGSWPKPSSGRSTTPPASPPRPASAATSTSASWRWTSSQSTSHPTPKASGLPSWTRSPSATCSGTTSPSPTFGQVGPGIAKRLNKHGIYNDGRTSEGQHHQRRYAV